MSIQEIFTAAEIQDAFQRSLRKSGRIKISNAIVALLNSDDTKNLNISGKSEFESYVPYYSEEGLALMQQVGLSKYQYNAI